MAVVLGDRDFFADIIAGDAQFLFHAEFNGQTVRIPAPFAFDALAFHGVVAAENILDGTGHDVVNPRHTVGRRRAFVENIAIRRVPLFDAFLEDMLGVPEVEDFPVYFGQVEPFEFLVHDVWVRRVRAMLDGISLQK